MLAEAEQACDFFLDVDELLTRAIFSLGERYGITPEVVDAHAEAPRPK